MSGGVGPTCDIRLPKSEAGEVFTGPASLFTFRQLNALVVMIVLAASGLVSFEVLGFVFFSLFYIHFISKFTFPLTSTHPCPPLFADTNWIMTLYVYVGALIGIFLPIAYIFHGVVEGDKEGIKAAAPHLFLLESQVFMEGLANSGRYSAPIRVFVPVLYNSMRIMSILEWVRIEIPKAATYSHSHSHSHGRRLYAGKALALANMGFWAFNLFALLLPFHLPKAFKMYYAKLKD